jgi:hypothetical protein
MKNVRARRMCLVSSSDRKCELDKFVQTLKQRFNNLNKILIPSQDN